MKGARKRLIEVKEGLFSVDDARKIGAELVASALEIKSDYYSGHNVFIDRDVDKIMEDVLINIIRYSFINELTQEG